jgi:glycosyltransferase involved in cell wall biosynthesis
MPKVSVITISYNNAEGLLRTMDSVIKQDYTDYEYIVIDGGSSDNSKEIINSFADKITYWVSEPDRGVYHAMNKGIAVAKGEYLHFLNAGDIYASDDVLSKVFVKDYDASLLRGIQICDYGNRQERWLNLGDRDVTLYDMYVNTLLHQATFIKSDLFQKYGLYDEDLKIVSDWKFFLQAILGGEKTIYLGFDVVVFEMEGISTNKEHGDLHLHERKMVTEQLFPSNILADYKRLKYLEQSAYISEFVKNHKVCFFFFRFINRMYKALGLK